MLGLGYAAGPFSTAATYERTNGLASGTSHDKTTVAQLGAAYALNDAWAIKGGYRYYKKNFIDAAAVDLRGDTWWVGVNYQATPALGLTAAVYRVNVKDQATGPEADPTMLVLRAKYALSKRTDLYAVAAHARAKNDQFVGLTRSGSTEGVTGFSDTQTGAMVGVQHRF
jgi:predicted porin